MPTSLEIGARVGASGWSIYLGARRNAELQITRRAATSHKATRAWYSVTRGGHQVRLPALRARWDSPCVPNGRYMALTFCMPPAGLYMRKRARVARSPPGQAGLGAPPCGRARDLEWDLHTPTCAGARVHISDHWHLARAVPRVSQLRITRCMHCNIVGTQGALQQIYATRCCTRGPILHPV